MGEPLLQVERLRVEYEDVVAVKDVSFTVESGMVYGLIGPNGAGKSSIIRSVAGLTDPSDGTIRVCGDDLLAHPQRALRHVGYMPDAPPLYEELTVLEFMQMFASSYGIPLAQREERIARLLEQVSLSPKQGALCGSLSRGMRQRLFLAKTLLHDPHVLLLDEPASGLDPHARLELCALLTELGKAGKAVLVSSHILAEMADFCNSVGIMERGVMVVTGRIEDILARLRPGLSIRLRLLKEDTRVQAFVEARAGVRGVVMDGMEVRFTLEGGPEDAAAILRSLVEASFPVLDFHHEQGNLQDIFRVVSTGSVT